MISRRIFIDLFNFLFPNGKVNFFLAFIEKNIKNIEKTAIQFCRPAGLSED